MINFLFLLTLAYGSELDLSYTHVKQGEVVPFSGRLLTDDAMIKVITAYESEIKQLTVTHEFDLANSVLGLNYDHNMAMTRCDLTSKSYEDLIIIRDEQIRKHERKEWVQRFSFYGGFALGVLSTVGIINSLN
tara:strand:+ start:8144 stop:8542 length:399 start_codon:yes stop_codon:yes gene_type:complete